MRDATIYDYNDFPVKKLGRRPLPEEKRRVQFGTRIAPTTLEWLKQAATKEEKNFGRLIDDLVQKADAVIKD